MIDLSLKARFSNVRFLFVIGQYSKLGGAERQALILAEQLKIHLDCHVAFLAWGGEGRVTDELKTLGIDAWIFPLHWNKGSASRLVNLWKLARFIRQEIRPNYLLPYIGFNCKIIGLIWRVTGAHYTWWNQRDEGRDVYGSWIEHRVINSVPDVVSNSLEGSDFLADRFGLSPDRITVLNNGISIPANPNRQKYRKHIGLDEQDVLIIMVANLTKYKDHQTLIKAFASLREASTKHPVHLLLVGRLGEITQQLKSLAFDLNLSETVHFSGEVEGGRVTDHFASADLAVHSSAHEGCPNAVLEAMAHGLPVCGTDISGIRQALGKDYPRELLAPVGDVDALKSSMQRLVDDIALRKVLGQQNLQRIKKEFSPEKLVESVLSLIRNHQER